MTTGTTPRETLIQATVEHLLTIGRPDQSLRSFATAAGVSHSLLLYHFGSTTGLLTAAHAACEQRQRDHFATMRTWATEPVAVMRAMWRHLSDPNQWSLYRLGFALRIRADVSPADQQHQRDEWVEVLVPLIKVLGVSGPRVADEALLWVCTCRGLLWELINGADARAVDRAAGRFFARYRTRPGD